MKSDQRTIWLIIALFAVVGLGLYSNVILNGIFIFDDDDYITENSLIQSFSYADLSDPRQIGYLSFALNYALGGDDPRGYHLLNVIIHITNSVLAFFLIRLLLQVLAAPGSGREEYHTATAFFASLVFLVHPLETMAVSYISQRFTSLAALFYLLTVTGYLMARVRFEQNRESRVAWVLYGCSLLAALLAVRTKEITFTLPVVLAAVELLALKDSLSGRRRFVYVIPFAILALLIPLSILGPEWGLLSGGEGIAEVTRKEKIYDLVERSPFDYLFTQFRVIVTYLRLLVLPVGQRVVYDYGISRSLFEWRVLLALCILLLVMAYAYRSWRQSSAIDPEDTPGARLVTLGIIWFFVTLSIESSVIPIKDLIFEHRTYLPSVGFFAACSALIMQRLRKIPAKVSFAALLSIAVVLVALPLSVATWARNTVWTDEVEFWEDVVKKNPDKAIGYHNRGNAYARRGRMEAALQDMNRTIGFFPRNPAAQLAYETADFTPSNMAKTYMNRASVYLSLGLREPANADLQKAKELVSMPPVDIDKALRMGDLFAKKGAYRHAIEEYSKVLQWDPENLDALNNRSNAYSWTSNYGQAILDLTRVIVLYPEYLPAYHNRGIAYAWSGQKSKAVADFETACDMGFQLSCDSIEIARKGGR